jgi:SOS response regulatory protein OraA/RecX
VRFDDGTTMRLYRQTIEDFGLYTGRELLEDERKKLQEAAGAMSAKMRAVRIVAASSVSQKDLERRLVQKGEDRKHAQDAVSWMSEMHLVDDAQTAAQVVNRCAAKGYGIARAKQALYEKRIPKQYWEAALADYPDQSEYIEKFLLDRVTVNAESREVKKAIDALLRRGHNYGDIRRVLSQLTIDTEEFPEG